MFKLNTVPPILLLALMASACSARLVHFKEADEKKVCKDGGVAVPCEGLRYRVQKRSRLSVLVVGIKDGRMSVVGRYDHASPETIIDEEVHGVSMDAATFADHELTVNYNSNGSLKGIKLVSASKAAEALDEAANAIEKVPDTIETLKTAKDDERIAEIERRTKKLEAEQKLAEARAARIKAEAELRALQSNGGGE